jgi:hypothetical protein
MSQILPQKQFQRSIEDQNFLDETGKFRDSQGQSGVGYAGIVNFPWI